ncbi:hypothetical protein [Fodinicurvata sediminis]|uniref:hypothetical protein n=1 Tax=Fodinicurvata sediminis TaxID=1121832 RepID=UPI0003B34580|nr:hypothetical protein [Fodinicurvata sediminis]
MNCPIDDSSRLSDLPFAGQFLIWFLRSWVDDQRHPGHASVNLKDGAQAAGLSDATRDLDRFMRTLAASAPGVIVIEHPDCRQLSNDEKLLLAALSSLQAGRIHDFEDLLASVIPPAAVRIARMPAAQFVGRFQREGLVLPECATEPRETVSRLTLCPDPGTMRLQ